MKKHLPWLILVCCLSLMIEVGCHRNNASVCTSDIEVNNTSSATLYYPCAISEPLPATTLMSGYAAYHSSLDWLANTMVENGFIVLGMTPTTRFGKNSLWRDAHLSGIAKLESLNSSDGPLRDKIDTDHLQVCGHSKGGGGALLASNILGPKLKSTVVMAPWKEELISLNGIRSPTLIQSGGKDKYVTPTMIQSEYEMLPTDISKAYFEYKTAQHFSWGVLSLGALHKTFAADIVAWMKYYLKGNTSQRSKLSGNVEKSVNLWVDKSGDDN